jgi:hypothetical protein
MQFGQLGQLGTFGLGALGSPAVAAPQQLQSVMASFPFPTVVNDTAPDSSGRQSVLQTTVVNETGR